jgi:hypothetical protein
MVLSGKPISIVIVGQRQNTMIRMRIAGIKASDEYGIVT